MQGVLALIRSGEGQVVGAERAGAASDGSGVGATGRGKGGGHGIGSGDGKSGGRTRRAARLARRRGGISGAATGADSWGWHNDVSIRGAFRHSVLGGQRAARGGTSESRHAADGSPLFMRFASASD